MTNQEITFEAWPKIPRLNRNCIITEKLDGTNAAVIVAEDGRVGAQSRNRLISPDDDNFGFARWVVENAGSLASLLGPGRHFGEWWGAGIQRGYGMTEKRFSLFNAHRWQKADFSEVSELGVVPILATHTFSSNLVAGVIEDLRVDGSAAAPGFMKPEGIVVFHTASREMYKVLIEGDDVPKGAAA